MITGRLGTESVDVHADLAGGWASLLLVCVIISYQRLKYVRTEHMALGNCIRRRRCTELVLTGGWEFAFRRRAHRQVMATGTGVWRLFACLTNFLTTSMKLHLQASAWPAIPHTA